MSDPENIVRIPELGLSSQLMDDLRGVINDSKYDKVTVSELVGVLEMVKLEYLTRWLHSK